MEEQQRGSPRSRRLRGSLRREPPACMLLCASPLFARIASLRVRQCGADLPVWSGWRIEYRIVERCSLSENGWEGEPRAHESEWG